MKKVRDKKKNKNYFTKENEDAILKYVASEDRKEREILFCSLIQPVFHEMIEKIVFTYRFANLPNIETQKEECLTFLVSVLEKYKESKGSAFSYFSVITRNWFKHKQKKNSSLNRTEFDIDSVSPKVSQEKLIVEHPFEQEEEKKVFWEILRKEIDKWDNPFLKLTDNERVVIVAIKELFDNVENIEIITRKSVYLYLREITNLPTKRIVVVLTKLRKKYCILKKKWDAEIF